jgi:uncharacterized damage-inducible protein DinB
MDRDEALHLLQYDAWACARMESALESAKPLPEAALKTWGHVVDSLECWLGRIEGQNIPASAWWRPAPLAEWKQRRPAAHARWTAYAQKLDARELAREVRFTNSAGQACQDPVEAIVRHLVNHGTHHRAQVASALRAAGFTPPTMDYIAWRRELRQASAR